jgi:hypothetical protein
MATLSYYLQQNIAGVVNTLSGVWVRLRNNSTLVDYVSTGATDGAGLFTVNDVPAGSYTVYFGPNSGSTPTATGDANFLVPVEPTTNAGDNTNLVLQSLTVKASAPYVGTAVPGGADLTALLRVGGPGPWIDPTAASVTVSATTYTMGALTNGVSDDAIAIQNADNAAAAVAGGAVVLFAPNLNFTIKTPINKSRYVSWVGFYRMSGSVASGSRLTWGGAAATGPSQNLINLYSNGTNGSPQAYSIEGLMLLGGWNQISGLAGCNQLELRDMNFQPVNAAVSLVGDCERIYGWNLEFSGGNYGWYHTGDTPNATKAYLDKSHFFVVNMHGQSINGWYMNIDRGNSCSWNGLLLTNIARDGIVAAGGLRGYTYRNLNTELAAGYSGVATTPRTTGTINSGTASLTVGATTGMVIDATGSTLGSKLTISGAGASGQDLIANISGIAGSVVTLNANAGTSVTNASTGFYIYSIFKVLATSYTGSGGAQFIWEDCLFADNYSGGIRYAIDGAGLSGASYFIGGSASAPIYDPGRWVVPVFAPNSRVWIRRPNVESLLPTDQPFGGAGTPFEAGQYTGPAIYGSPSGQDLWNVLRDSLNNGSGSFGNIEWRKLNQNNTVLARLDSGGHFYSAVGGLAGPATSALAANVTSATPGALGAGSKDMNGRITIVVGGGGVAANTKLFTLTFANKWSNLLGEVIVFDASTDSTLATVKFTAQNLVNSAGTLSVDIYNTGGALTPNKTYIVQWAVPV